jgi:DNA-binding FadR family transcriptional regulator
MHPNPPGKRSLGLAHDLVALLTQHIRAGKTLPGEKMPSESMIVREHRVSRTVVREAISKLQASGLVETRHGIGTFVLAREERSRFRLDSETAPSIRGVLEVRRLRPPLSPRGAAARPNWQPWARPWTITSGPWATVTKASRPAWAFTD